MCVQSVHRARTASNVVSIADVLTEQRVTTSQAPVHALPAGTAPTVTDRVPPASTAWTAAVAASVTPTTTTTTAALVTQSTADASVRLQW